MARALADVLAREVADVLGDVCVVRLLDGSSTLTAMAVHQRVPSSLPAVAALDAGPPLDVRAGWNGQAVRKNTPVRLPEATWEELSGSPAEAGSDPRRMRGLIAPLRGREGVIGTVTVARDISEQPYSLAEQRHLERVLARAGGELAPHVSGVSASLPAVAGSVPPPSAQRMLELSAAGVWVTDRKARTVYMSAAASELLGRPATEVEGRPMGDFLDDVPQSVYGALHPAVEHGDHEIVRPDGTGIWAAIRSAPWLDDDGRWCGTINSVVDITERKEAEIRLRLRANAERTIAELSMRALRGEPLEELMQEAVEAISEVLGLDYVSIGEWLEPCRMRMLSSVGYYDDELASLAEFEVPASRPQRLAADIGEPVVIRDYDSGAAFGRVTTLERKRVVSSVYVPIASHGVIGAHSTTPRDFDAEETEFVEAIAGLVAARWADSACVVA
jgi:PAS domain S-box-containing protein